MKRCIVISPVPPYATLCKIMFLDDIIAAGIEVEYWNVAHFTWGWEQSLRHGPAAFPQRIIKTEEELGQALDAESPKTTLINIQASVHRDLIPVYKQVRARNFTTSVVLANPLPDIVYTGIDSIWRNAWKQGIHILKIALPDAYYQSLSTVWRKLSRKKDEDYFYNDEKIPYTPDIVFAQGQLGAQCYPKAHNVPCNWVDYEQWLKERHDPPYPGSEGACVFLDEALCIHPDTEFILNEKLLSAEVSEAYYSSLCALFVKVKKELQISVIIAAHPKARYDGHEFGGRQIIQGHTVACVRGAKVVLSHASATTALAAMYTIPLLLITNNVVKNSYGAFYMPYIKGWSKALDAPVIDSDNLPPLLAPYLRINNTKYQDFLYAHHTWPQYKDRPSGPDVANFIKQL